MKFKLIIVLGVVVATASVGAFETDDAYNQQVRLSWEFNKADKVKDRQLTEADGAKWGKYKHLDADADGAVSYAEFVDSVDLPYYPWTGEVKRNLVVKRVGEEPVLLDIYQPMVKKYEKAPVFYYVHGGGWSGGTKEMGSEVKPMFEALSREGVVCVSVMYRLVKMWKKEDPVLMRDCVVDCCDGLRFLKKYEDELGLDMNRVVVFGPSAGGHIIQLLTWSAPDDFSGNPELMPFDVKVSSGISWYGPSDFRDIDLFVVEKSKEKYAPDLWATRITKSASFSYKDADAKTRKMADEVSPVCFLTKDSAPLLHFHGDQDVVIPTNHARHLKRKAAAVGADVTVKMVAGAGHGWRNPGIEPDRETIERMTVDFALAAYQD